MGSPFIISRGAAIVRVGGVDAAAQAGAKAPPDLALTVSEASGRTVNAAFWGNGRTSASPPEEFRGLRWSLAGPGLLALKTGAADGGGLYGVAAIWPVAGEAAETFARLAERNAAASVETEPGCRAFGVFRSLSDPTVFALLEVFDGADGFERHFATGHFRAFAEHARPHYLGDRTQTLKGAAKWA